MEKAREAFFFNTQRMVQRYFWMLIYKELQSKKNFEAIKRRKGE
jgi:hypothetical protein